MLIQNVLPEIVQDLGNLRDCLNNKCRAVGMSNLESDDFISIFPANLLSAQCFLDRVTNLWRYEFGLPSDLSYKKEMLWGTYMWPPVNVLFHSVQSAKKFLVINKLHEYMQRLANIDKHQDTLVEMFPVFRLNGVNVDFEVSGEGVGNKTIDWKIGPVRNRFIRIDVKNRMNDLYSLMDQDDTSQPPQHNYELLFRSIENKFLESNPEQFLQGIWIVTQIKQQIVQIQQAFDMLCPNKIHFAILGDHREDALILVRREQDLCFIQEQFVLSASQRFTFEI